MKTREQSEQENMALAAELARQLCHDFSNFIYNLFLQIEIGALSTSASKPNEWDGVKREGKKMVRLMQEWEKFQSQFTFDEMTIDLHQMIQEVVEEAGTDIHTIQMTPSKAAGPMLITGSPVASKHLLLLLIEDAFQQSRGENGAVVATLLQAEVVKGKAIVRISFRPSNDTAEDPPNETRQPSLLTATCRSLALRLDATIQRDLHADGLCVIQVEFPQSQMEPPQLS